MEEALGELEKYSYAEDVLDKSAWPIVIDEFATTPK